MFKALFFVYVKKFRLSFLKWMLSHLLALTVGVRLYNVYFFYHVVDLVTDTYVTTIRVTLYSARFSLSILGFPFLAKVVPPICTYWCYFYFGCNIRRLDYKTLYDMVLKRAPFWRRPLIKAPIKRYTGDSDADTAEEDSDSNERVSKSQKKSRPLIKAPTKREC